ncbi:DUF4013 domain-containing protein [Methanobrevibacter sp.]|uniref:DUF4013 domain-containing protein n=1 Tax=Methanobrevibacter sp. TaxID=66852 RepID=UPI0025FC37DA|nr:DUF4013 domain-containing protein [Methanobrevibacter sp.]MBQ2962164.1 DUF4013 domain-containing protein [Methanobrevibacter sp.]
MEIMEIIKDAALYPINNVKALVIYAVLMIVAVLVLAISGVGLIGATDAAALGILGIIGIIIALAIFILIAGYMLDVIKMGINREDGAPEIDAKRQIINGIKFIILAIIYLIIPFIVMAILSSINETLGLIVGLILCIIFAILLVIAQCRFAKTESLGEGLNFSEVIGDLKEIGIVKVLAIIILVSIIAYILSAIGTGISGISETIGSIITAILSIYVTFFQNRAYGLLYSDAE